MKKAWYSIKARAEKAEIWIYEEIGDFYDGGVSAKKFAEELTGLGKIPEILLHLNSPGGVVFDGIAIYNLLKQHRARVTVSIEGLAASIASVVAMAGDEISMAANGLMMIHDPWGLTIGNSEDHRRAAEILDKLRDSILLAYLDQTGDQSESNRDKFIELMAAETWMSAEQALELGLIHQVTQALDLAASFDLNKFKYKNIPEQVKPQNQDRRYRLARHSLKCQRLKAASGS